MRRTLAACAAVLAMATASALASDDPAPGAPLWSTGFDDPGSWTRSAGIDQFGGAQNASVVPGPAGSNGTVLRVRTPAGQPWGIDLRQGFDRMGIAPREEAWLRYRIWFPHDFEWAGGGKIPGLAGITDGDAATSTSAGGDYDEASWSGRLYWKENGGLVSYLYVKHAGGRYIGRSGGRYVGISPRWYVDAEPRKGYATFTPGAWNTIEIQYRMNTPGQNDGWHRGWLNGRLAIDLRDVQYRTAGHADLGINQLFAAVFFGGSQMPRRDQVQYLDDMSIAGGPVADAAPSAGPGAPPPPGVQVPAEVNPRRPAGAVPPPAARRPRERVTLRLGPAARGHGRVTVRLRAGSRRAAPVRVLPRGRAGTASIPLPRALEGVAPRAVRADWRPGRSGAWRRAAARVVVPQAVVTGIRKGAVIPGRRG
ncbi:MAG: polysaccharide lyase [Thermoleophilia bacterium]